MTLGDCNYSPSTYLVGSAVYLVYHLTPAGRSILRRSTLRLAQERLPKIHSYVQDLFKLPPELSRCAHVLDFFRSDSAEDEAVGLDNSEPFVVDRTNNHAHVDVLPEEGVQFDNPAAI